MRLAFAIGVAAAVLVTATDAATVHPRLLVLRTADVPAGFVIDREDTGVRSNAAEGATAEDRRLLRRFGRLTGYVASWDRERGPDTLTSRADLFRESKGARMLLDLYATTFERAGIKGMRRSSVRLGAQGWVWHGGRPGVISFVVWRHRHVVGYIAAWGLDRDRTLVLARAQQRRIAAALG